MHVSICVYQDPGFEVDCCSLCRLHLALFELLVILNERGVARSAMVERLEGQARGGWANRTLTSVS